MYKTSSLKKDVALLTNIRLGWKDLPGTNSSILNIKLRPSKVLQLWDLVAETGSWFIPIEMGHLSGDC